MNAVILDPHPLLDAAVIAARLPAPLSALATPRSVAAWFAPDASAPVPSPAGAKTAVRDLLRHGGFKPAGRSKPASEYLVKAREKGWLAPDRGINAVVDALNAVSLHSGLPISVVDADLGAAPWRIGLAAVGSAYVFNASGQVIDLSGLLCLFDAAGPCANPVKDSQRTKTHDDTVETLSVVWGTTALPGHTARVADWYATLLAEIGADVRVVRG
jgi:DNA/RNA-binding domain of Phe-tRNA-synthetase-like protein